jgi:hypothetical protein
MILRLPDSGSWLSAALRGLGEPMGAPADSTIVENASDPQVREAFEAMTRGDIEYMILEDGNTFLQSAGDGEGPYQLQFRASETAAMVEIAGGVDGDTARQVLLDFLRGTSSWQSSHRWTPCADID